MHHSTTLIQPHSQVMTKAPKTDSVVEPLQCRLQKMKEKKLNLNCRNAEKYYLSCVKCIHLPLVYASSSFKGHCPILTRQFNSEVMLNQWSAKRERCTPVKASSAQPAFTVPSGSLSSLPLISPKLRPASHI